MKHNHNHTLSHKDFIGIGKKIVWAGFIVVSFFIAMYLYRCGFEKVCRIHAVDALVRRNATIIAQNGNIVADIVDTEESREQGLSNRPPLDKNVGLLFVFDMPSQYGFWMKDMKFALDIIWMNEEGTVVALERDVTPDTYPKIFVNSSPAKYVLEINAGEAEKMGIFIGSKLKIER